MGSPKTEPHLQTAKAIAAVTACIARTKRHSISLYGADQLVRSSSPFAKDLTGMLHLVSMHIGARR